MDGHEPSGPPMSVSGVVPMMNKRTYVDVRSPSEGGARSVSNVHNNNQHQLDILESRLSSERLCLDRILQRTDELRRHAAAAASELSAIDGRLADACVRADGARAEHAAERQILEKRVTELLTDARKNQETMQELEAASAAAELRRHDTRIVHRRRLDSLREAAQGDTDLIQTLRDELESICSALEEAMRRRHKAQEEELKDRTIARRRAAQEYSLKLADLERNIRLQTDKSLHDASNTLDHLSHEVLPALHRESAARFAVELERRDAIIDMHRSLIGADATNECITTIKEQTAMLEAAIDELMRQCAATQENIVERDERISTFQDAISSHADIEQSLVELHVRQDELSEQLAELYSKHAVWKARNEETERLLASELSTLRDDIDECRRQNESEKSALNSEVQHISSAIRSIETEIHSLMERKEEIMQRNRALETALQHIARQRQQMTDDMNQRRDAAKAAAVTLLSQLE